MAGETAAQYHRRRLHEAQVGIAPEESARRGDMLLVIKRWFLQAVMYSAMVAATISIDESYLFPHGFSRRDTPWILAALNQDPFFKGYVVEFAEFVTRLGDAPKCGVLFTLQN